MAMDPTMSLTTSPVDDAGERAALLAELAYSEASVRAYASLCPTQVLREAVQEKREQLAFYAAAGFVDAAAPG